MSSKLSFLSNNIVYIHAICEIASLWDMSERLNFLASVRVIQANTNLKVHNQLLTENRYSKRTASVSFIQSVAVKMV